MKTIIIYNDFESGLKYALLDGDFSKVSGVVINGMTEHKYMREAIDLIFDNEGGYKIDFSKDVSLLENKKWDKVAIVNFIP